MSLNARLQLRLQELERQGLSRHLPPIGERRGVEYGLARGLANTRVIGFCSNDYLGLAAEPAQRSTLPAGASASRLICGDHDIHRTVEAALATLGDAEDAVLFPSGFQLNVGVLPALIERGDTVFSDALNHASIIDGLRLARVRPEILAHKRAPEARPIRAGVRDVPTPDDGVRWWVSESIYSMDGDAIDPADVARFEAEGGCAYVDEAHAMGLYSGGRGLLADRGVRPTLLVGTLSKAFGIAGAFVAGSATACHYIRTRARSFVFSTGVSPAFAETILHRIARVQSVEGERRREQLWANVARMSARLGRPTANPSPIFPIKIGANELAVQLAGELLDRGFHVQAIRPPTVPAGSARLRLTVCASHSAAQIDGVAEAIVQMLQRHGLEHPSPNRERPDALTPP